MIEYWTAGCMARRYEWLKTDDGFAALVALGRCLNQMRFGTFTIEQNEDDGSPASIRQLVGALFVVAAALPEGIDLAQKHLRRRYHRYPEFDTLAAVWKNPENRVFLDDRVRPLRNRAVSHFDPDETKRQMSQLTITDECVFAEGRSDSFHDLHYKLSDALALMTFVGDCESETQLRERLQQSAIKLGKVASEFIVAADGLIGAVLHDYGFETHDRRA